MENNPVIIGLMILSCLLDINYNTEIKVTYPCTFYT